MVRLARSHATVISSSNFTRRCRSSRSGCASPIVTVGDRVGCPVASLSSYSRPVLTSTYLVHHRISHRLVAVVLHAQGKRKSKAPPPKKVVPKVDTTFTCPFCNHDKSVIAKMDHLTEKGLVECTVCGQKYTCNITHLSEPIDVYSDWIDACDKANKTENGEEDEGDDGTER